MDRVKAITTQVIWGCLLAFGLAGIATLGLLGGRPLHRAAGLGLIAAGGLALLFGMFSTPSSRAHGPIRGPRWVSARIGSTTPVRNTSQVDGTLTDLALGILVALIMFALSAAVMGT